MPEKVCFSSNIKVNMTQRSSIHNICVEGALYNANE